MTAGSPVIGANALASRPLLVEIAGVAGAGKTAVRRAVSAKDPTIQPGFPIPWRRSLLPVCREGLGMARDSLELLKYRQQSWWLTTRHLLRVRVLERVFTHPEPTVMALLLDEGPVYGLCRVLLELGYGSAAGITVPPRAWQRSFERWTHGLDLVVWLDASDDILRDRIRERPKAHRVKHAFDAETYEFLHRYRVAYRDVLGWLGKGGTLSVMEVDTGHRAVADVAATVRDAVTRLRPPSGGRES